VIITVGRVRHAASAAALVTAGLATLATGHQTEYAELI
jgi:hypothetical protein